MNPVLIVVIAGVVIIAGVLVYMLKFRNQKKGDVFEEDLTTEIETTDIYPGPPPAAKETKKGIGELDVFVRDKKISTTQITDPEMRIGRDPTRCAIVISEPIVSKRHCSIITRKDRVFIVDNDSTNGTYINNEKISEKELKTFDTILLGKKGNIKLVFRRKD